MIGIVEFFRVLFLVEGLMNLNDVIVGGNVEVGNVLVLEEVYAVFVR